MGLDQAVFRMTPETAELAREWMADNSRPSPYRAMEQVWAGRKENHIQCFMEGEVGEVVNCDYLFLTKEHIERLVDRLQRVKDDHSQAGVLLPTEAGFFFGGTDYDEFYFEDIEAELKEFRELLDSWDDTKCYAYWAWW